MQTFITQTLQLAARLKQIGEALGYDIPGTRRELPASTDEQ